MKNERIANLVFKPQPKPEIFDLKQKAQPKAELKSIPTADKQLFLKQEQLGNDALKLKLFSKLGQPLAFLKTDAPVSVNSVGFEEPYPPGPGLQFSETKSSCYLASQGQEGEVYQYPDGSYWRVDDVTELDSGIRGVTLRQVVPDGNGGYVDNPNDDRVVVGFAGSNALDDWDDNIGQGLGFTPTQYDQALAYTNSVMTQAEANGESVNLAGHSLGGGLAAYCSIETGLPATTINAAPLSGNKIPDDINFDDQITQYYVGGESLTDLDNINPFDARPGEKIEIDGQYDEIDVPWNQPWKHLENVKISGKNHSLASAAPEVPLPERV